MKAAAAGLLVSLAVAVPPPAAAALQCGGRPATAVGTAGDDTLVGTPGPDVIVGLAGNDTVKGYGRGDRICTGPGDDVVLGGSGADRIWAGPGSDIVLAGAGDDAVSGGAGVDFVLGGAGDDAVAGGTGLDVAGFLAAPRGVTADLRTGTATGEGTDSLSGVEGLLGSGHDDVLSGNAGTNMFLGAGGDDIIIGRAGSDFALYTLADDSVTVDLAAGTATGGEGADILRSVENVSGSPYDDVLTGDAAANFLSGEQGDDRVDGADGRDLCYAETAVACIEALPVTAAPPAGQTASSASRTSALVPAGSRPPGGPPPVGLAGPPRLGRGLPESTASAFPGALDCPTLTGSSVLSYPGYTGYGFWAWRTSSPAPVGAWSYGPWLYNDGAQWSAYMYDLWWTVGDAAAWPGGSGTAIEAWWYHYGSAQWVKVGECATQPPLLVPGLVVG